MAGAARRLSQALPLLIASDAAGRRLELALSAALAVASSALTVLPSAAALGALAASLAAVACVLLWSVASLVTYAQARRAQGLVTSGMLRAELAD